MITIAPETPMLHLAFYGFTLPLQTKQNISSKNVLHVLFLVVFLKVMGMNQENHFDLNERGEDRMKR